jgi:hypothetical protein
MAFNSLHAIDVPRIERDGFKGCSLLLEYGFMQEDICASRSVDLKTLPFLKHTLLFCETHYKLTCSNAL